MVGQLQEEEKALGLVLPGTDRKASTGKPFPSPTHPSLCLSWQQTSRISCTRISRNKAQKFSLLPGVCSPAQRRVVLLTEQNRPKTMPRGGTAHAATASSSLGHCCSQVTENICPPSSKDPHKNITFLESSHYTSTEAGSNVYFSTKCSHDNDIFI